MPFDVYDINNRHMGVITSLFPNNTDILMVGITNLKISDIELDLTGLKNYIAELFLFMKKAVFWFASPFAPSYRDA